MVIPCCAATLAARERTSGPNARHAASRSARPAPPQIAIFFFDHIRGSSFNARRATLTSRTSRLPLLAPRRKVDALRPFGPSRLTHAFAEDLTGFFPLALILQSGR